MNISLNPYAALNSHGEIEAGSVPAARLCSTEKLTIKVGMLDAAPVAVVVQNSKKPPGGLLISQPLTIKDVSGLTQNWKAIAKTIVEGKRGTVLQNVKELTGALEMMTEATGGMFYSNRLPPVRRSKFQLPAYAMGGADNG